MAASTVGTAVCQEDGGTWAAAFSHTVMGSQALSKPPPLALSPFLIAESVVTSESHGTDCSGTWEAECRAGSLQALEPGQPLTFLPPVMATFWSFR